MPVSFTHVWRKYQSLRSEETSYPGAHDCVYVRASECSSEAKEIEAKAIGDVVRVTVKAFSGREIRRSMEESFRKTTPLQASQQWRVRVRNLSQIDGVGHSH